MRVPPLFVPMENKECSDTSNNWAFPALLQGESMFAKCSGMFHPRISWHITGLNMCRRC